MANKGELLSCPLILSISVNHQKNYASRGEEWMLDGGAAGHWAAAEALLRLP